MADIEITDRKEAIAAAVKAAETETKPNETTKEETIVEEPVKKEEKTTTTTTSEPADKEDILLIEQGKQLITALRNPDQAPIVIKFLAEQAGYEKKVETKAEAVVQAKGILDDLKESLGSDFEFLADKIAPALEKALAREVAKSNTDIRQEFARQEQEKVQNQSTAAINKLSEDFFGSTDLPDTVVDAMSKYMDRVTPNANISVKDYVEDAFNAAIGKLGLVKTDKAKTQKTERNRTDASSRLSNQRAPAEEAVSNNSSKPVSRRDAIRLAVEAAEKAG